MLMWNLNYILYFFNVGKISGSLETDSYLLALRQEEIVGLSRNKVHKYGFGFYYYILY